MSQVKHTSGFARVSLVMIDIRVSELKGEEPAEGLEKTNHGRRWSLLV